MFDISLVIRIEAWHCRKQKIFACITFHIINGACSLPYKRAPWIILQCAVENCAEPFPSKSETLTVNSPCFVRHCIWGIKSNKKIQTWSSYSLSPWKTYSVLRLGAKYLGFFGVHCSALKLWDVKSAKHLPFATNLVSAIKYIGHLQFSF